MEIDEIAARLLRQYWALVLLCVLAPLVAITLMVAKQPPMYAASARIVSGSTVPASNAQAQALVSQIQGIATGKTTAASALQNAHVTRNVNNFITSHVSVAGLGGSQVVDLTVTDRNPRAAATLAKELAEEVVQQINRTGQSGLSTTLNAIDQEIVRLSEQHGVVASQAAANPRNEQLQSKLAGLNQVIANFSGDRSRLLIQASTQGLASVLDQPVVPQQPQSKALRAEARPGRGPRPGRRDPDRRDRGDHPADRAGRTAGQPPARRADARPAEEHRDARRADAEPGEPGRAAPAGRQPR